MASNAGEFVKEHTEVLKSSKLKHETGDYLTDPFNVESKFIAFVLSSVSLFILSALFNIPNRPSVPEHAYYHFCPWTHFFGYWFGFLFVVNTLVMLRNGYVGWKMDKELESNSDLRKEVLATLVKRAADRGRNETDLRFYASRYILEFDIATETLAVVSKPYPSMLPLPRSPISLITECVAAEMASVEGKLFSKQTLKSFISDVSTFQVVTDEVAAGRSAEEIVELLEKRKKDG